MPLLRQPLYQRAEGADDDRWRLVLDTETPRLFVEHEATRGDMRGFGYSTFTDDIELAAFLGGHGATQDGYDPHAPARQALVELLGRLFDDNSDDSTLSRAA